MQTAELPLENVGVGLRRIALRTPTLPPATHTNSYLVGDGDFIVVEPASPYAPEQALLHAAIDARLAEGHRLLGALLTHHHADHVSGAWALRERYRVPVMAHAETGARLARHGGVDRALREGDEVDDALRELGLRVLHTPGHAPGHLCLFAPSHGWMIVGDMVASVGTILVDVDDDGDMDDYVAQLGRLAGLAPSRLLPAHGDPIDDGVARLQFYVRHRNQREEKIFDAVRAGADELGAIVAAAYDDTPVAVWPLAARAARAHLARLRKRGRVDERRGRYHASG
ncbi:MAG: MBL fold metallo-hydrolase [Polyangiales bacterium]